LKTILVYELVICIHQILTFSTYFNKTRYFDSGCMTAAQALQQVRKNCHGFGL